MSKETLIIGKKAILDAIKNNTLTQATITSNDPGFCQIVRKYLGNKLLINNNKVYYDKKTFPGCNHQYALGYVCNHSCITSLEMLLQYAKANRQVTILVLDSIHDPYNFGSIIRTAENFHVDAIIFRKDRQCQITPIVRKVSAGAISNINLFSVTNLHMAITQLKNHGFWVYASCLGVSSTDLRMIKFANKSIFIVGNEDKGISKILLDSSDFHVKIHTLGQTQSLNVAVATGIFLYAKSCQKN